MKDSALTKRTISSCSSFIIVAFILIFCCSGCVFKKQYVGNRYDTSNWEKYSSGKALLVAMDAADFEMTITKTEEPDTYILEGIMDGSGGSLKSIGHLVVQDCRFGLVLAKGNVVIDNIAFFPSGNDHTHKLPFKRKFKTTPFDSVTVWYQMSVSG